MEWKGWEGKWVFLRTRHGKVYSGTVKEIDLNHLPMVWLILIDKFNERKQFCTSEIVEIKEESMNERT